MRIQHNIPAMNSYRNYSGNVGQVSKNLEKLSTGYKINRAGDNAAGLAISEKMRAQITGLEKAQANAKDGISLVQTAEGALTEVHSMLNRMLELADQSANGTYDNTTDRKQLQKEVTALKTEIDRIADSSNFNGIKLLDGSLEDGGATQIEIRGNANYQITSGKVRSTTVTGLSKVGAKISVGDKITINMVADDGSSYTIKLFVDNEKIVDQNSGTSYVLDISTGGGLSKAKDNFLNAMKGAIRDATGNRFELTAGGATIKSTQAGAGAAAIIAMGGSKITISNSAKAFNAANQMGLSASMKTTKVSAAATVKITKVSTVNAKSTLISMKKAIFTINGQDFLLVSKETDLKAVQTKIGDGVTVVYGSSISKAAGQIAKATGLIQASSGSATFRAGSGEGLRLQIGDTSDEFNKMTVSVKDIHVNSLGLGGLDIGNQGSAATAVTLIKNAINVVSDVRGGLGAIQNRLDHTIKNLSVMQENIQDAESSIRDVDVADEMMKYTKNNILVQSAQAMLAQANQMPQGVLQLLG